MSFPKVPISIIIVCIIFAILGGLWGAQVAGVIDIKALLGKLPFIEEPVEDAQVEISPLEEENKSYRRDNRIEIQLSEANQSLKSYVTEMGN